MKKLSILAVIASTIFVGGCQNFSKTIFAHIKIDNSESGFIAQGNAYTNFCLSNNMIDRQLAYDFSTAAAEMLNLVVFDNKFYKTTYDKSLMEINEDFTRNSAQAAASACSDLQKHLPTVTENLRKKYHYYARELGIARSEENKRLTQQLSNFNSSATKIPQTQVPMNFPNVEYGQKQPQTQNFLINTKNGITQCRVTKSNFVFCL